MFRSSLCLCVPGVIQLLFYFVTFSSLHRSIYNIWLLLLLLLLVEPRDIIYMILNTKRVCVGTVRETARRNVLRKIYGVPHMN